MFTVKELLDQYRAADRRYCEVMGVDYVDACDSNILSWLLCKAIAEKEVATQCFEKFRV